MLVMRVQEVVNCAWKKNTILWVFWILIIWKIKGQSWLINADMKVNIYFAIRCQTEQLDLVWDKWPKKVQIYLVKSNRSQTAWIQAHLTIDNKKLPIMNFYPIFIIILLYTWKILFYIHINIYIHTLAFEKTGFQSQLREASMSSHTDEFW